MYKTAENISLLIIKVTKPSNNRFVFFIKIYLFLIIILQMNVSMLIHINNIGKLFRVLVTGYTAAIFMQLKAQVLVKCFRLLAFIVRLHR